MNNTNAPQKTQPRALLYIRVSTDEQANKGYSLRAQEDQLRGYCMTKNYEIVELVKEDYSAKTFERPAWKDLLFRIKKGKIQADMILFTKWDRFSRNTHAAYDMIGILKSYAIVPQAIEQIIDFEVPENRILLSVYLSTPEVDNLRRSMNVKAGLRKKNQRRRMPWHGS